MAMNPFDFFSGNSAGAAARFLAATSLKATVILLSTLIVLALFRRSSAALRHWVLSLALASVLLLPALAWFGPAWSLAILPGQSRVGQLKALNSADVAKWTAASNDLPVLPVASSTTLKTAAKRDVVKATDSRNGTKTTLSLPVFPKPQTRPTAAPAAKSVSLISLALLIWLAGAGAILLRWLVQYGAVWRITRRGFLADPAWADLLDAQRRGLKIRRRVALRYAPVHVPMTWGLLRPAILLPFEAAAWDEARRRVVLLHELAHVARWDYLTQWISLICCALNWFNPLVWIAVRRLALEREQASDDLVLRAGVQAADYAGHLLDIARAAISQRSFQMARLAMAQRSNLEHRIRGILNTRRSRRALRRTQSAILVILLVVLMPLSGLRLSRQHVQAASQGKQVTLTVAIPIGMQDGIRASNLLADFEAQHPGVTVQMVDSQMIPDASGDLQAHFDAMQKYADSADILLFANYDLSLTPFDTRAGYVLDLAPLINSDASFPVDDFYPQMWSAYQWDNGIWGVPFGADMFMLSYNPQAFDKAGLTYPDGSWTLDQFTRAVTQLTIRDANGNVVQGGFANTGRIFREALWRSLMDGDAVDPNSSPNAPQFSRPDVEAVIGAYHQLEQQGNIGNDPNAAMFVDSARKAPQPGYAWALLPGGRTVLMPFGFAISAGTQQPELAYDLLKYLSGIPYVNGGVPARKSLAVSNGIANVVQPEYQALIQQGFDNALNYNDLRFFDYLNDVKWTSEDAHTALQDAEESVVADLQTADSLKGTLALAVSEPQPQTLPPGKIALNFDLVSNVQPLPTRDQWDRVIQDFTASDPDVGAINLRVIQEPATMAAANSDCFYLPENAVSMLDAGSVLPLDPLMNADPAFDRTDYLNGVLSAVQRDGQTYALPLDLEPLVLRYDSARFSAAHLPEPGSAWTVEDFTAALAALQPDSQGQAPFVDAGTNGAYLLVLIASYGGLPLDYRTTPPTINFTDPATVTAIRQVLDLARNGQIHYSTLGDFGQTIPAFPNNTTAIYSNLLDNLGRKIPPGTPPDNTVLFPSGRQYNGLAYNLGAGYISTGSQNPEACYRFISTLAQHPELFPDMPVRRSQVSSAVLQPPASPNVPVGKPQASSGVAPSSTAPNVLAVYQQVETLLSDSNTVVFPINMRVVVNASDLLLQHWLFQAFDAYVLHDGDLESALANAQTMASAYQICTATLPPVDVGTVKGGNRSAFAPYVDCAEQADMNLKPLLDPMIGR